MFKKISATLLGLIALFVIGYYLLYAIVSHETRIRWMLEEMQSAFNEGEAFSLGNRLAEEFRAQGRLDRRTTILAIAGFFQRHRRADGTLSVSCEIDEIAAGGPLIEVKESDPPEADLEFEVVFFDLAAGGEDGARDVKRERARAKISARLILEEGKWRVLKSSLDRRSGALPF